MSAGVYRAAAPRPAPPAPTAPADDFPPDSLGARLRRAVETAAMFVGLAVPVVVAAPFAGVWMAWSVAAQLAGERAQKRHEARYRAWLARRRQR